jgi:hypothetical protein
MMDEIKRLERRPFQFWFEDGIWEMAFGAMILFLGIFFLGQLIIPRKPLWLALWVVASLPVLFFSARFVNRGIQSSKEKWTYPRAGFVSYQWQDGFKRSRRYSWRGAILGAITGFAYPFLKDLSGFSWPLLVFGFIWGMAIFYIAVRTNQARFFLLSIVMLIAGIILARARVDVIFGLDVLYAVQGMFLIVSGRITFGRFVRQNPVREENEP